MKKLVVLLMLVGSCFSFAACGGDAQTGGDNNNVESSGNNEGKDNVEDIENNNESKEDIQVSDERIFGEWVNGDKVVVINEDGICTMNGVAYTWKNRGDSGIDSEGNVQIEIEVLQNDEFFANFIYMVEVSRSTVPYLMGSSDFSGFYHNESLYDKLFDTVEMTTDNFWDYFEVAEVNGGNQIFRGIQLKKEYRDSVVMGRSVVEVEMNIPQTKAELEFDETAITYTIISSSDETMVNQKRTISIQPGIIYAEIDGQYLWVLSTIPAQNTDGTTDLVSLDSSKYEMLSVEGHLSTKK